MGQYKTSSEESQFHPELECLKVERNATSSDPESDLPCQEFDDVLEVIGPQGIYQKLLLYAVVCPITAIEPFLTLNAIFLLFQPDHWCFVPGRDNGTDIETWKSMHIPLDFARAAGSDGHTKYSQCTMYGPNRSIVDCPMGWEYDKSEYLSTMSSAYNWVCGNSEVPTNSFTAQAVGNAVGTMIFGHLADKVGRKPIFFLTILINVVFRYISFFVADNVELFLFVQFLVGTAFPLMFIAPSMIVAEICDKDYRGWVYAVTWMIWVVGMAALPVVVWAVQEWFAIGIATTLPGVILFLYWFHLPESPRWLFSVGKLERSSEILMEIAKSNGRGDKLTKPQLDKTLKRLHNLQIKNDGPIGVWTLFGRKRLAKNTIMLTLCWSINIVVYYGLTLNTTRMSGNQFVNFFLLSIIELPSGMTGAYLVDRVGRRWTQVVFFCGCAFTCGFAGVIVQYMKLPILEVLIVVLAKFAVTLTFLVVYLQGAEIFPTQLRSTGSGFASTIGAACGIVGPIMVAMGAYHLSYPYWIMGGLCFLGMICAAFLPETLNQNLPESIDDAEEFGKGNKFWSLLPPKPIPRFESVNAADSNHLPLTTTSNHVIKPEVT